MSWESIISKKYSEDTLFMTFDNLEELIEAMLENETKNAESLNVIYNKVKSGKINKDRQKDYLMNFKKYVSRKHGQRKQWVDLVSAGKFWGEITMNWENIFKSESRDRRKNDLIRQLYDFLEKNYPVEANYAFGEFLDKLSKMEYLEHSRE